MATSTQLPDIQVCRLVLQGLPAVPAWISVITSTATRTTLSAEIVIPWSDDCSVDEHHFVISMISCSRSGNLKLTSNLHSLHSKHELYHKPIENAFISCSIQLTGV